MTEADLLPILTFAQHPKEWQHDSSSHSLIRRLLNGSASTPSLPNQFRPELLVLEGRVNPAELTWVGSGMGAGANWNVAANWDDNEVPGADDIAIFDATAGVGANTNCTMNLGGVGSYHVGKLVFKSGYTGTLTLNANLFVDILDMRSAATIKPSGTTQGLAITQQTAGALPHATMFGTSHWIEGTIETAWMQLYGEDAHHTTLQIGLPIIPGLPPPPHKTVTLKTNLFISDVYSTVNWLGGDVTVEKGKTVQNKGTFLADSPGNTMGNNGPAADKWTFDNRKDLNLGEGKFKNVDQKKGAGAREFKISSASPSTGVFEIVGTYTHDVAGTSLSVESGTLKITGTFTQSAGSTTLADETELEVTGAYTLSGGTVAVSGPYGASLTVGSFTQSGGSTTVQYGTLTSTADIIVSGGTLTLSAGTLDTAADVEIQSGGTLAGFGTVDVSSGTLVNAGTITVGGTGIGTLAILGDYTQTGVLNLELYDSSYYDQLDVSGLATLDGTLNVTLASGASSPGLGSSYNLVSYGSRSGTFATINLPPLSPPLYWNTNYGAGALGIWVGY